MFRYLELAIINTNYIGQKISFQGKCFRKVLTDHYFFKIFGISPSSPCFKTTTFRGMALPSSSGAPTLVGPVDGASLYRNVVVYKQGNDGKSPKFKK
jgi:hypothetical protein